MCASKPLVYYSRIFFCIKIYFYIFVGLLVWTFFFICKHMYIIICLGQGYGSGLIYYGSGSGSKIWVKSNQKYLCNS
jgi:hypothetical protein